MMTELEKGIPQVGLRLRNPDEAWQFWVAYGGHTGFDVRKRYRNLSKFDGKVTSCRFVCANEDHRRKVEREHMTKCFRAETRTNCKARMTITLDRGEGNYEVTDVVLEHNHLFHLPETRHLMASQRKISELQAFEIETADDYGIRPKNKNDVVQHQVELKNDDSNRDEIVESQDYNVLGSFTHLITAPTYAEENLQF